MDEVPLADELVLEEPPTLLGGDVVRLLPEPEDVVVVVVVLELDEPAELP